ncbi:TPA: hypothetical protein ACQJWO_005908, partial [Klebsiella pneumoniae]
MKLLFSPAQALMDRLAYPYKFGLLGALALLAFASLMWALAGELRSTIRHAQNEQVASALAHPLSRLIELTQQHRGLSSMVLNGNSDTASTRSQRAQDVQAAVATLHQALAEDCRELPQWQAIRNDWNSLNSGGLQLSPADNIRAH